MICFDDQGRITFGMYRGKLARVIAHDNPKYVIWALSHVERFRMEGLYELASSALRRNDRRRRRYNGPQDSDQDDMDMFDAFSGGTFFGDQ